MVQRDHRRDHLAGVVARHQQHRRLVLHSGDVVAEAQGVQVVAVGGGGLAVALGEVDQLGALGMGRGQGRQGRLDAGAVGVAGGHHAVGGRHAGLPPGLDLREGPSGGHQLQVEATRDERAPFGGRHDDLDTVGARIPVQHVEARRLQLGAQAGPGTGGRRGDHAHMAQRGRLLRRGGHGQPDDEQEGRGRHRPSIATAGADEQPGMAGAEGSARPDRAG